MKKTVQKRKTSRKRKKNRFSDGLRAFLLAGLIVVSAIAVSLTIISIHTALNKKPQTAILETEPPSELQTVTETVVLPVVPSPQPTAPTPTPSPPSTPGRSTTPSRPPAADNSAAAKPAAVAPKPVENQGTLVFVIDDAGNNLRELEPFLRVPGPLTIAVLPGLPYSAEAARRIRAAGKEVILHQPMEAIGAQNPGPGAIYSNMSADEIRAVLSRNIAEIGPVTGINNHQGSRITMDREAVQTILAFCAEHNLYFLDSRTTADTVVPAVARQMGMKIAERNVFIDNEQNKNAMIRYIETGLVRAQRNGSAVMIGHAWSPALAPLLTEKFPVLIEQGYTIKTAFDIIK
jgi:hypothetical protein